MNSMSFLIGTLFDLYLMVVILRVWLQLARADFYNPFSQFVIKATDPCLRPLRRIIPGWGGIDNAAIVLAFIVATIKLTLLTIVAGSAIDIIPLLFSSLMTLLSETFSIVFWVLIIRALLSWVSQGGHNPIEIVLHQLTEPMLAPIRKILPPMGGFDLSILVFLIGLQFLRLLITDILRII